MPHRKFPVDVAAKPVRGSVVAKQQGLILQLPGVNCKRRGVRQGAGMANWIGVCEDTGLGVRAAPTTRRI